MNLKSEDELVDFYVPTLVISRKRKENDREYMERMNIEEEFLKRKNEKEKLEYMRLKSKFEGNI